MVLDGYLKRLVGQKLKKSHEKRKGDMMGIGRNGLFLDVNRCGMGGNHLNSKEIYLILD
jgi:hypothetical protein